MVGRTLTMYMASALCAAGALFEAQPEKKQAAATDIAVPFSTMKPDARDVAPRPNVPIPVSTTTQVTTTQEEVLRLKKEIEQLRLENMLLREELQTKTVQPAQYVKPPWGPTPAPQASYRARRANRSRDGGWYLGKNLGRLRGC